MEEIQGAGDDKHESGGDNGGQGEDRKLWR